jgi:hypothetical protein
VGALGRQSLDRAPNRLEHQEIVRPAGRYRTVQIRAGRQTLTAAEPVPDDLAQALTTINSPTSAH